MEIHHKIRLVRKLLGLSQVELSERLEISQNEVSKMESGKRKFVPDCLIKFLIENEFDLNSFFDENIEGVKRMSSDESNCISLDKFLFEREDDMNALARFFLKYSDDLKKDVLMGKVLYEYEKKGENKFLKTIIEKLKSDNTSKANWIREYLLSVGTESSDS